MSKKNKMDHLRGFDKDFRVYWFIYELMEKNKIIIILFWTL